MNNYSAATTNIKHCEYVKYRILPLRDVIHLIAGSLAEWCS